MTPQECGFGVVERYDQVPVVRVVKGGRRRRIRGSDGGRSVALFHFLDLAQPPMNALIEFERGSRLVAVLIGQPGHAGLPGPPAAPFLHRDIFVSGLATHCLHSPFFSGCHLL